jgi:hypothetical protein
MILYSLEEKTKDPASHYHAAVWYPKALQVQQLTKKTLAFIEELKKGIKSEAAIDPNDERSEFREDDRNAVKRFFVDKGKGRELFTVLSDHRKELFQIDTQVTYIFKGFLFIIGRSFELDTTASKGFNRTFFNNLTTSAALTRLSQFQNNVKLAENMLIQFCNDKVSSGCDYYSSYSVLVGQNKGYFKAGERLQITAGVGTFSHAAMPIIIIDSKTVDIDATGVANYKFKVVSKPGKYTVPVQINFTDQDGNSQTVKKDVEYTILEE